MRCRGSSAETRLLWEAGGEGENGTKEMWDERKVSLSLFSFS